MKLTMLGTGNAAVTEVYNTCFAIEENGSCFLIDGGGGSQILSQLKKADIALADIRTIFVTHKHIDHLLGIVWMVRMLAQNMAAGKIDGNVDIYAHDEVIGLIWDLSEKLLQKKQVKMLDTRIFLKEVKDGEHFEALGHDCTAFDIGSTKAKQFGFLFPYGDGKKLCCCGDEPYCEIEHDYAFGSDWLLHEAFCLFAQADQFKPYEKHHSTAKDAAELAAKLQVKNLLLYHTEDKNIAKRKELYTAEAKACFDGNVWVPEDLESFEIL